MNARFLDPLSKSAMRFGILSLLAALTAARGWAAGARPTADEIVARYVKARGGLERLAALRSLKFTGHVANLGIESPFVTQMKRPDLVRTDMTVNTFPMVQAYDGKTAWIVMPLLGSTDPEDLPEAQARDMRNSSSIDGPLVDYKAKGNTVELLGKEDVEGKPAYKLKLTLKDGSVRTVYLDEKSGLEVELLSTRQNEGGQVEVETFYSDYRPTEGILFPRTIENRIKGKTSSRMWIDTVELNPPIEDAIFRKPAPSPAPPPAK
jgi:hypothetical protein